jgi:hypothetical protein
MHVETTGGMTTSDAASHPSGLEPDSVGASEILSNPPEAVR